MSLHKNCIHEYLYYIKQKKSVNLLGNNIDFNQLMPGEILIMVEKASKAKLVTANLPSVDDVIRCIFKVKDYEMDMYLLLLGHAGSDVQEIADLMGRDRSAVQRSIKILMNRGFVNREFKIKKSGGFKYIYNSIPLEELKSRMRFELTMWSKRMDELISSFDHNTPRRKSDSR